MMHIAGMNIPFWSLCRSWTSRLVYTIPWWTLRQGNWRPKESFHGGGEGGSEMEGGSGKEKKREGGKKGGKEKRE